MEEETTIPVPHRRPLLKRLLLPTWPERRRMFVPQAWIVVVASYALIIFAHVFPQDFRIDTRAYIIAATAAFMIHTFLFHLGLLLCLVTAVAVCLRRRWLTVAVLPLVVYTVGPAAWSYMPASKPAIVSPGTVVMSVNLLGRNQNTAKITGEVLAAKPDLLLLQEYRPHWHEAFQARLAGRYPFCAYVTREDDFGFAVYSRLPFTNQQDTELTLSDSGVAQARVEVQIHQQSVALYNIHLMPPKDVAYTIRQRREFSNLLKLLRQEQLPIILCGDFNFTNAGPFAARLKHAGLIDAHLIGGYGRGSTWPVLSFLRYVPGIRLDHIYISKELTSTNSRTGYGSGSDHRPVITEIGFKP